MERAKSHIVVIVIILTSLFFLLQEAVKCGKYTIVNNSHRVVTIVSQRHNVKTIEQLVTLPFVDGLSKSAPKMSVHTESSSSSSS